MRRSPSAACRHAAVAEQKEKELCKRINSLQSSFSFRSARSLRDYFNVTLAPSASNLALISSASALDAASFNTLGAPSTKSLASFKPRPVNSRTTLITLTFEAPDMEAFPSLRIAIDCGKAGGTLPCVFNAANEEAVYAFLDNKIKYLDIPYITEKVASLHKNIAVPCIEDIERADAEARAAAQSIIANL